MGRKAISTVPKTERPLRIRLTDEERTLLDIAAERDGKATSTWARDLLLTHGAPAPIKPASKSRKAST